jgi:hypothetical protein
VRATLVPDLLTPAAPVAVVRSIRSGLETLLGRTPSNAHVAVLTAQSALESGRWRSMHRFNLGNVKASESYEYLYCQFRCDEVIGGKLEWFDPPHPQTNFRAFMDLDTGAMDYLRFLAKRARYSSSWHAAESGDPALFVHALKNAGYFTADEAPYRRAVQSLFVEYMRLLDRPDRDTEPLRDEQAEQVLHAAAIASVAPDADRLLHTAAVLAMDLADPLEWARQERREQMREP